MAASGDIIQASDFNKVKTDLDAVNTKLENATAGGGKTAIQIANDHMLSRGPGQPATRDWYNILMPADGRITEINLMPFNLKASKVRPKYDIEFTWNDRSSTFSRSLTVRASYFSGANAIHTTNDTTTTIFTGTANIQGNSSDRATQRIAYLNHINTNVSQYTATSENDTGSGNIVITITPTYDTDNVVTGMEITGAGGTGIPTNWSEVINDDYNLTGTITVEVFVNGDSKGTVDVVEPGDNSFTKFNILALGNIDLGDLNKDDVIRLRENTRLNTNGGSRPNDSDLNAGFIITAEAELD